jgi:2-C-methyl-D-erythritol 2,4-cyclodiphosphate synthase
MSEQRIGLGVDLHRFATEAVAAERPLVLGGHVFPGETPLVGHSDADVVAHAVGDGILGAAGLGDLGLHFPDSDARWRGADSLEILRQCVALVAAEGWRLVNSDCTVVCERPKLAPVREEMMERLSAAAGAPVHVKATRPEGLGSLGRVEGIACLAVVLLER